MNKSTVMAILIGAAGILLGNIAYAEYIRIRSTPTPTSP